MKKTSKNLLLLLLFIITLRSCSLPFDPVTLNRFSTADWMVKQIFAKTYDHLTIPVPEETEERKAILDAFFQGGDEQLESLVEEIIATEITEALMREGISPFPPVVFEIGSPPTLLIVSRRDEIVEVGRVILSPEIADDQKGKIESYTEAERPDRSALVVDLGGISLFPPAVCRCSAKITIEIATHEWGHTYLFFFPLGARYNSSPEMVTINEVVVSIVAEEIAEKISAKYGWGQRAAASADPSKGNEFGFDEEMRKIRRRIDQLLAQGKAEEAEAFMEEKRIFLCEQGHCLRKLNQAYFAFHGSYEGGAAGEDPIPGQLRALRSNCNSLREFLEKVREVSSYQEFQQLLEREGIK